MANSPKTILITGASTGIGFHTAILLSKEGHRVYATMRNTSKAGRLQEEAEKQGARITILKLDVQDEKSITRCVGQILENEDRIDILINNAGAGFIRTLEQASMEEIQQVMDVNFYGVIRCTKAVLPVMRKHQSGHIINISSIGGIVGQPVNEIYCAAKFALEGLTESIASYMKPYLGINVSLIEPGGVITEFGNSLTKYFEETGGIKDDDYKPLMQTYMNYRATFTDEVKERAFQKPLEIAEVILKCINDPEPKLRYLTSDGAAIFTKLKTGLDPDGEGIKAQVRKGILNR